MAKRYLKQELFNKREIDMKIAVLLATGTEEIEVITPIDVLRRAGVTVDIVSVSGGETVCSHNVQIVPDKLIEQVSLSEYDGVVIPGGMPGAVNIANNQEAVNGIKDLLMKGKLVSAICASPAVVLAENGMLNVKRATCYPLEQFVCALGDKYTATDVEVCDNVITANGPKSALKFALSICEYLGVTAKF